MTGRESVFSDPRIISVINQHFVPLADDCGPLQTQRSEAGEFFRLIAEQGHYAGRTRPTSTRQGLYAAAPDGRLLASVNSTDPERVLAMIRRALDAWESGPAAAGGPDEPAADRLTPAAHPNVPDGGLVLKMYVRDLPRGENWHDSRHNFDHVWFTREEVEQFVPAGVRAGDRFPLAPQLVARLARYHLVDTVRGQCPPWSASHFQAGDVHLTVESIAGNLITLRLEGHIRLAAPPNRAVNPFSQRVVDRERGIDARLLGYLTYDRRHGAFERFRMVAAGPRWGAYVYNGRFDDPGPAPIGFAFEIARGDNVQDRTPPMAFGSNYFGK